MRTVLVLAVLCTLSLAGRVVEVQSQPGAAGVDVAGIVSAPDGTPQPGVLLQLRQGGAVRFTAVTAADGSFRFIGVPPASYEIAAVRNGTVVVLKRLRVETTAPAALRLVLPARARDAAQVTRADEATMAYRKEPGAVSPSVLTIYPGPSFGEAFNTEAYSRIVETGFLKAGDNPLSTFSIDVDTASYANVRRFLQEGRLPPPDAVRTEELLNYFRFDYPAPPEGGAPFAVTTEVGACPWNPAHRLALIGLQARRLEAAATPPRNLVFLLDVSGSMASPDKLPLVRTAMKMLVDTLTARDRVAVVVYAGASGLALPSTPGDRNAEIQAAIAKLEPGGSTNGAGGIRLAYDTATSAFVKGGINRVILATDGDFNVGVTSEGELTRLIEQERERGIFLSVLGVGTGNLKDTTMEQLADKGNGNYAYLDSLQEARRVLVAEAGATLVTVAKDVKIQVEFNPAAVAGYRLIGYENRRLAKEDFNDDRKDAGEIGAGHSVTALYEIVPVGQPVESGSVDPLKYQSPATRTSASSSDELMTVKLRYKQPDGDTSQPTSVVVRDRSGDPNDRLGFAAAVAEFGMLLRGSEYKGASTWASAIELARRHRGVDPDGYRAELVRLMDLASALPDRDETMSPQTRR